MLRLEHIGWQAQQRHILEDICVEFSDEGISVLLGHNGAGKTVLLQLIAGLLAPQHGRLVWRPEVPRVAMVFQQTAILRRSVWANVAFVLGPLGLTKQEATQRSRAVLQRVGLWHRRSEAARLLSGGERQRLALARAWAVRPHLLLLDEPTASLDPTATQAVERLIREIRTDGSKVIMSTHNMAQAMRLADDIVFLDNGRIEEHLPSQRFFSHPQSPAAQAFIKGELPWRIAFET